LRVDFLVETAKLYMRKEECSGEGELGVSLAERTVSVDPLNLIQVMLAEGKDG